MIYSLAELVVLNFLLTISIFGYSKFFLLITNTNKSLYKNFYSINFLLVLFLSSYIVLITIFFAPISDLVSIIFYFVGLILLFVSFKQINLKFFLDIIFIVILASFFSFFSLESDDFSYHLRSTLYFQEDFLKNDLINKIEDGPRVAYNSIWFLLNSLFSLNSVPSSFSFLSSVFFSCLIYDFFKEIIKKDINIDLGNLYAFFSLIYLLGVLGKYKNFGSDTPGQLILIIIIFIFLKKFNFHKKFDYQYFILISILVVLISMIKITNILIMPLVFLIFYKSSKKFFISLISIIILIPFTLWIYSNYIISGCLIFPLEYTCFNNNAKASSYNFVVSAFAKNVLKEDIPIELSRQLVLNFGWIKYWASDHLIKIIEKNIIYLLLILSPILWIKIKSQKNQNFLYLYNINKLKNLDNHKYITFLLFSIFCIICWFFLFPSFRFGSAYVFNFIIIFAIPLWIYLHQINTKTYLNFQLSLFAISFVYFVYRNITKIFEYLEREGNTWPMITKCSEISYSICPNIF